MTLEFARDQWNRFQKMERLQAGIAVYVLAIAGLVLLGLKVLKGNYPQGIVTELPLVLRPLAYIAFVLLVWSAFQVFDRLLPHALHLNVLFLVKIAWVLVLLLWPIGPMIYYLVAYHPQEVDPESTSARSSLR